MSGFKIPLYHTDGRKDYYHPLLYSVVAFLDMSKLPTEANDQHRDANYRVLLHENIHHFQRTGTTLGLFCSLCDLFLSRECSNLLADLNRREWKALRRSFESAPDYAPFQFDSAGTLIAAEVLVRPRHLFWKYAIHMNYATRFLLRDFDFRDAEVDTGSALSVALLATEQFPMEGNVLSFSPPTAQQPIRQDTRLLSFTTYQLTTDDILESAATANDYLAAGAAATDITDADLDNYAHHVAARLFLDTGVTHNRAFRVFLENVPQAFSASLNAHSFRDTVLTFLLLADLALNPPLPPIYECEWQQVCWLDTHPPMRFMKLLEAAETIPHIVSAEGSQDDITNYMLEVCTRAGIRSFALDASHWPASFTRWDREQDVPDTFSLAESYARRAFTNFAALRSKAPACAAAPGLYIWEEGGLGEALHQRIGEDAGELLSPFYVDEANNLISAYPDENALELAGSMAARYLLYSVPALGSPTSALNKELLPPRFQKVLSDADLTPSELFTEVVQHYTGVKVNV